MGKLTDRAARNIKPGMAALPDGTITGLSLLSGKSNGRGRWRLRYVSPVSGKRRDMGLGVYPEVSIAESRQAASAARALMAEGKDPVDKRNQAKAAQAADQNGVVTFEEAARIVHEDRKTAWKNAKHSDQWINTLSSYVFPTLGNRPVDTLKPADFAEVLRPIWLSKAETASRVKQRCNEVMEWCWGRELVTGNPLAVVPKLLPKQPSTRQRVQHHPAMPWQKIPGFLAEEVWTGRDVTRALLEFVILTAARSGEARAMIWDEVDISARTWTIPANRMKTGRSHRVPLSGRALEILNRQQQKHLNGTLVFPAPRGGLLTDMVLTSFLRKHKAQSDVQGRFATAHGFRASFRNWASEHGYARDLAERALAHTIRDQSEAAYHRTDLLEQRRPMMDKWGAFLTSQKKKSIS